MGILSWILLGLVAGALAKFIMPWLLATTDDQESLITVTHKGYTITEAGLKELDIRKIPNKGKVAAAA